MADESKHYEQYATIRPVWGWVILVLMSAAILGWGMFMMLTIKDRPREWDFGVMTDTPAQSIYSSVEPDIHKEAPYQVEAVPGAKPVTLTEHSAFNPPTPREEGTKQ